MPNNDAIINQLKADALAAARATTIPRNPRAFELADRIWALSDDFLSGAKQLSPRARAMARDLVAYAKELNRRRGS
jgi:hypothetical protein